MVTNAAVLSVKEKQLVDLINQIVFDAIEDFASKTFADNPQGVLVTKEKLAAIMGCAAIMAHEAGRTGIYKTTNPSIPKLKQH